MDKRVSDQRIRAVHLSRELEASEPTRDWSESWGIDLLDCTGGVQSKNAKKIKSTSCC
jgi:hypothetical protein